MPIKYDISHNGKFIHAVAEPVVTSAELFDYENNHLAAEEVQHPVRELIEVRAGAFQGLTREDFAALYSTCSEERTDATPHRCAIVVSPDDCESWDTAKFYESMAMLHRPEVVIVFGDLKAAKLWLGVA